MSTEPRTVTVHTDDHGDVTLTEPFWCLGEHDDENWREDICHQGEELPLVVQTDCHGEVLVASASLYQTPFSDSGPTGVTVTVEFSQELHQFDAAGLASLADTLVAYGVGPLHQLVERLQLLEGEAS